MPINLDALNQDEPKPATQRPVPRSSARSTAHPTDVNAVKGASANALATVGNKTGEQLQNVEHYINRAAQERQDKLHEYADAIAYLNDGDAFMAELACLVEEKLGTTHVAISDSNTVEATAVTLDRLDPYAKREFEFKGKFFSGSTVGLLGGN